MRLMIGVTAGLVLVSRLAAGAESITIQPVVSWSGTVEDAGKRKAEPDLGLVTDQKALAALWKAWRGAEEVPQVDFRDYFIIVRTVEERRTSIKELRVDERGDGAATHVVNANKDLKGFGYAIAVFPRAQVKTFGFRAIKR